MNIVTFQAISRMTLSFSGEGKKKFNEGFEVINKNVNRLFGVPAARMALQCVHHPSPCALQPASPGVLGPMLCPLQAACFCFEA